MFCGDNDILRFWIIITYNYTFQDPRLVYVIADESLENDEEILFSRAFDVSVLRRHGDPEVVQPRTLRSIIVGASKKIGIWVWGKTYKSVTSKGLWLCSKRFRI